MKEGKLTGSDIMSEAGFIGSPYVVADTNHFCEGFATTDEAKTQAEKCQLLREKKLCIINGLGTCMVIPREDLGKIMPSILNAPFRQSCPFGSLDGRVWESSIRVVTPLTYAVKDTPA